MAAQLEFFDMAVSITPPNGHLEPLPITLGPNWQPNDVRLVFVVGGGSSGQYSLDMAMLPDPPTGFTSAYSLDPNRETFGTYYRRLRVGDTDTEVAWVKPVSWEYFMFGTLTVRGVSPTANPTAGRLGVTYITADTTTGATVDSVLVPGAGAVVLFVGNVAAPEKASWPHWAVAMGTPDSWTHLVATDKSGTDFNQFDTSPALMAVARSFTTSGSTGPIVVPAAKGSPAFAAMYAYLPAALDVSATIGAA